MVTKVLHIKRPSLVPILDSFVERQLGASPAVPTPVLLAHVRAQGRRNLDALQAIQATLKGAGIERSLVRILDALLWSTDPASELGAIPGLIAGWERRGILLRA